MKRALRLLMAALGIVILGSGAYVLAWRHRSAPATVKESKSGLPRAPAGVRVQVQVLNTTRTRGLARRATRLLRDRGFDVVEMGTAGPLRDSTLVLDRSGHPMWAATIAQILGPAARSASRPDTSRYLDITVLLGSAWHAPAQPLDP